MPHQPHRRATRRFAALAIALVLPLVVVDSASAQQATRTAPALAPGSHVRVRVDAAPPEQAAGTDRGPARQLTGELLRLDADSIVVLTGGGAVANPRERVREIAVNTGPRPLRSAIWRGVAIGGGIGAVVGAASALASYEPCGPADFLCPSRGGSAAIGGIAGGLAGSLVGGVIGGVARRDRWATVTLSPDLRVGVAVAPRGVGLAIHF